LCPVRLDPAHPSGLLGFSGQRTQNVADVGRPTNPSSRAYAATSLFPIGIKAPVKKLCHNCDTEPVSAAQSDFIDDVRLLILRKLLKTKMRPKNPAYRLARYFFNNLS
jgi:hypothetical protein